MILPVLTLVLAVAPYVSRIVRATLLEVLDSDYVELARLKGIPETRGDAQARPAQRDRAGDPGDRAAAGLAGRRRGDRRDAVQLPGHRGQLVDSVNNHDVPMVQALAMMIAAVYVGVNLIADLLSILLTPRARTAISS